MNSESTKLMSTDEAYSFSQQQKPFSIIHKTGLWVLLTLYWLCVLAWLSPEGALKSTLLPFITPLIQATSIGQSWSVFSPDVREANYHETALIRFDDGLLKLYEFPRMERLDYFERFRSEKYRKMFLDCMPWPEYSQFLPEFAEYVLKGNAWQSNPPQTVSLIHNNCRTPPPDVEHWVNRCDLPEHTKQTTYYFYFAQTGNNK